MLRWLDYLIAGLRGVLRHKMRSFLAVMGIVLAISALLSMLAVGEGARAQILKDMEHLGLRNIIVTSRRPPPKPTQKSTNNNEERIDSFGLTKLDALRCKESLPSLRRTLTIHEVNRPVVILGRKVQARVLGVNDDYFKTHAVQVNHGRLLCALDSQHQAPVCLVATPIPAEILHGRDPYGVDVIIGGRILKVVGSVTSEAKLLDTGGLSRRSAAESGSEAHDSNKEAGASSNVLTIYMPFDSAFGLFGSLSYKQGFGSSEYYRVELDQLILEFDDPLTAVKPLEAVLRKGHSEVDYEITVPVEVLRQRQHTQNVFNLVLLLVAGITLLVGGVGIVNIMLVSVTERTKEIGIRRALGARRSDIMVQFLIETLALTMTGGIIGILAGFGGVYAVESYTGWPVAVTLPAMLGSFLLSVTSGVAFGMYPAHKAASVTPMIALRYE